MADARGVRLLADLNNAFKKDPNIDEYDTLPVMEPKHNRSPIILQDHKLGVEAWAVKILIKYSALRLNEWRKHKTGQQSTADPLEVCHLSRAVLLFSPQVYTAWNVRKELIEQGHLSLSEDFTFGGLVLSRHPNSSEAFIHRRWLFQQLLDHCLSSSSGSSSSCSGTAMAATSEDGFLNMDTIDVDIGVSLEAGVCVNGALALESGRLIRSHTQKELDLCYKAAENYSCNYYAWSHRIWVMQHCLNCSLEALLSELKTTEPWTSQHISDHSGFHYRQFLLSELHSRHCQLAMMYQQNSTQLFIFELSVICELIQSFPGHEALWYHRRFLFQNLLNLDHLQSRTAGGQIPAADQTQNIDLKALKSAIVLQEVESVTKNEFLNSNKYQQTLARKYVLWLQAL